jgi:Xaa-Pro aminopeptidase
VVTASFPVVPRLSRLRTDLSAACLDAFVVTHLPNLRYLTGFAGTAGAAVVTGARCVLIVDFRYAAAGRELLASHGDAAVELDVTALGLDEAVAAVLQRVGVTRIGIEAGSLTVSRFNRLSAALASRAGDPPVSAGDPPVSTVGKPVLVPAERLIELRRMVKDAGEIATLREAARRLSGVAHEVPGFAREGRSELAVAADIDAALRSAGFERPAFDTIVASGPNSARPHARPGPRALQRGDGVVLDFGGVYDGYCVDLTRTLQLGSPAAALRRAADAVKEAHAAAIAAVRPGARPSEIDAAARDVLKRHGLGDAFGHGTGHGLGLEVHEEPRITRLPAALPDTPVEAGMVFTIEPGAYLEGLGGLRIEDDVLVVDGGCEVLTDVPIEP